MEDLNSDILKRGMRTIWKAWAAFLFAFWAYIRACHYLEKEVPYLKEYDLPLELIKYSFFALALIALYLSHYFRKTVLKRPSIKSEQKIIERAKKSGKPAVLVKYSTIFFVSVAFSESICLLGVVYFFLSGDYETLYVLVGIAAIAMLYYRPKAKELASISIASEGAAPPVNGLDSGGSL